MVTGATIRARRVNAGISGQDLCTKLGFSRSRLTAIEQNHWKISAEELQAIDKALDGLIEMEARIAIIRDAGLRQSVVGPAA